MSSIFDIAEKYLSQKKRVDELSMEVKFSTTDFDDDLTADFDDLKRKLVAYLNKTEPVIKKVTMIYEHKGLEFSNGKVYINGNLPRKPIDYDEEECFNVAEFCIENINSSIKAAVAGSFDSSDIKKLCICHFTMRHLISDLDEYKKVSINKAKKSINKKNLELENAKTELESLSKELAASAKKFKSNSIKNKYQNKIFLGYKTADCSKEVKSLLKKDYGFKDSDFFKEPIVLGLAKGEKNVAFFENVNRDFNEYLKTVYFNNAVNFDSKLRIVSVDDNNGYPASQDLFSTVKNDTDKKRTIKNVIINLEASGSDDNLFDKILGYRDNKIEHIEKYNKEHDLSLKDYILVFVDNFPGCIDDDYKKRDFIKLVNDSARMGFFFIINGRYDEHYYSKNRYDEENKPKDLNSMFTVRNNNIELLDFESEAYSFDYISDEEIKEQKGKIYKYNRKLDTFLLKEKASYLGDLLDENAKYKGYNVGEGIDIPVAFTDAGNTYYFSTDTKKNPFAVLTGNTGSGKTAFLHTLILCGALKYSPDELQFYIADFKDKQGSADFEQYTFREGIKNMYIPHIKYLSTKSSKESAFDMLDLINMCASENLSQIRNAGFKDFATYNSSDLVLSGKLPKLAQKYFIIDEYATMVNGGVGVGSDVGDQQKIKSILADILRRIRTSGVGIILSGQTANILPEETFAFFKNQIVFDLGLTNSLDILTALNVSANDVGRDDPNRFHRYISNKQGFAISRKTDMIHCIHGIYCGDIGSPEINYITDVIRKRCGNKYSTKQIVPGSDSLEPANTFLNEPIKDKENRKIMITSGDNVVIQNEYDAGLKQALYLGITNTTSVPTALKFYANRPNYLVCASELKLSMVAMNSVMAALYETRMNPLEKDVTYISVQFGDDERLKQYALGDLKAYASKYKFIKQRVDIIEEPQDALDKVVEMYNLFYDRKIATTKKKAVNLDPKYLIINKIDWMFDEDIINILNEDNEEAEEVIADDTSVADDPEMAALFAEVGMDMSDMLAFDNAPVEKKKISHQGGDIIKALTSLVKDGPQFNVFCVMTLSNPMLAVNLGYSSLLEHKSLVLGSFDMVNELEVKEFGESLNTCYVRSESENSVIRLYDYKKESASKWWSNLKKEYEGGKE